MRKEWMILFAALGLIVSTACPNWMRISAACEIPAEVCTQKITLEVADSPMETRECALKQAMEGFGGSSEVFMAEPIVESDTPALPDQHTIEDFPIIWQMPELPTGCEVTALTMALRFYGYDVSKTEMAGHYLPTEYPYLTYGSDGTLFGLDLNQVFVGDPFSDGGYTCGTSAILTAANDYLAEQGNDHTAVDLTGSTPEKLYALVAQDTPIVVWVTIGMTDRYTSQGWYTESGEYVDWSTNDHGAVLIGFTEETVTIADPISRLMEYDRQQFESVFESRKWQCVIITESQEAKI